MGIHIPFRIIIVLDYPHSQFFSSRLQYRQMAEWGAHMPLQHVTLHVGAVNCPQLDMKKVPNRNHHHANNDDDDSIPPL